MAQPDTQRDPKASHPPARWRVALERIPRKARLAIIAALIVVFGLGLYSVFGGSATLNLVCRHNLRNAELSVLIDGRLAHVEQISGVPKKRFGLLDTRITGSFSKSLATTTGHHVVQVRVRSAADGYDQTRSCGVNLVSGENATVTATTVWGGMSLSYQGPPVAAESETASAYLNSLRTLLVTILGSAVSAAIGFVVQEALRSRRSAGPVQTPSS